MYMTESKRKRPVKMRLKNLLRNSFFSLLSQFALIIIGFFSQRVVVMTMGENLVGMNSVIYYRHTLRVGAGDRFGHRILSL